MSCYDEEFNFVTEGNFFQLEKFASIFMKIFESQNYDGKHNAICIKEKAGHLTGEQYWFAPYTKIKKINLKIEVINGGYHENSRIKRRRNRVLDKSNE